MLIQLSLQSGAFVAAINKVLSCSEEETLKGVHTLSFKTLLIGDLKKIKDDEKYTATYNGDEYDVATIKKALESGLYVVSFTCEHISYRLSDYSKTSFIYTGTPREILTELLKDTPFRVGTVEPIDSLTLSVQSEATVRSIILSFASEHGYDAEFTNNYVSIYTHIGSETPIEVIDKNVVSISKTITSGKDNPSYTLVLSSADNIRLGDELKLSFAPLGIEENVRLIGIKKEPFTSKHCTLEIGAENSTLEADIIAVQTESVGIDKSYYGIRISEETGLTLVGKNGTSRVIMNADEFRMQAKDEDGNLSDRLYFDPVSGGYKFVGNVSIDGGEIDIGGNFKVDSHGNAYLSGDSTIYGGKYYAGSPSSADGYSEMTQRGFEVFNSDNDLKLRLGYTTDGEDFPFVQLGSGSGQYADFGLIKKFSDGLWIGNSEPSDESGTFTPQSGYNGIFFRFSDNTAYVVKDTVMKNIYTGAAIARFG